MSVPNTYKITGTGQTVIGEADERRGGKIALQVSGTFVGSLVPWVITRGGALAAAAGLNIAYTPQKTGTLTDGATTAITAPGAYTVALEAGQILVLNCSVYTSGTIVVDATVSPSA